MQDDKIKLLEFITNFNIGGTERHVVNLTRGLDLSRFELHIACFGRLGQFFDQINSRCHRLSEYPIDSLYGQKALRQAWKFARYLRRNRIQIVHSYGFWSNFFSVPAARLSGVTATIASIRDMGDPLTSWQRRAQRMVCRFAHIVLVNSDAVKRRLVEDGYCPDRIEVIRNGIVPSAPACREEGGLHRDLQLPNSARLVAVIARLNPLKGIEYFLEAAALLAPSHRDVHFLVVGGGIDPNYTESLKNLSVRLGLGQRVIFTGLRLDIVSYLPEISVSVLPSLSEGLSNVLLESMAAGVPVVATRVGGNPEAVVEGETGILVQPHQASELAAAIDTLLRDTRLATLMGAAGRLRAATCFSLERMVDQTQKLYLRLLEGRTRSLSGRSVTDP